jgi:thiosulfate dehydrogenase [quinone] large subunit
MRLMESSLERRPLGFYIVFFILRISLGGAFLEAGVTKLFSGFSLASYLRHGTGPFASWFAGLVPAADVLNNVVIWGETLIGVALILGILLRFASFWGAIMMLLYYLPYLPPSGGWISQQIIYLLVFVSLMFTRIGYFLGLDWLVRRYEERGEAIRMFFG